MKNYSSIQVCGRTHVVCNVASRNGYPEPNYMNTGKALCGVVDKGSSLDDWKKKHNKK